MFNLIFGMIAAVYEKEHELNECRHRIVQLERQLVKLQRLNEGLKNISYDLLQFPEREYNDWESADKVVFKKLEPKSFYS